MAARGDLFDLHERGEDLLLLGGWDPWAGVANEEHKCLVIPLGTERDFPLFGEFEGVVEQITEYLPQPITVCRPAARQIIR